MLALAVVSGAAAAGPGVQQASTLRTEASVLDTRAHHALLDLYALDTQLQTARSRLAALRTESAQLRTQQIQLAQQLSATQHTLKTSRRRLGENLRTLYEQGDTNDALAVMLGSKSLDDAVTTIDALSRFADESRQVVDVTNAAQLRLGRLRATISARRTQLSTSVAAAQQTTDALASARSERLGFLTHLRTSAAPTTPADTTPAAPAPVPVALAPTGRTITVSSTGYSLPGHTATGMPVGWGVVAVDPSVIPLGTRLTVPGYGEAVAADTGSAVRGATIDLWFPTLAQARAWGRRTVTITLH